MSARREIEGNISATSPHDEFRFDDMREEHLPEVLVIEQAAFSVPWSEGFFRDEIVNERSYFHVMLRENSVIGYGGFWLVVDEAHIANIAVHPDYRRQGLGAVLLRELLHRAVHVGARRATLEVRESNSVAQGLYRSFGFESVAIRKQYYVYEGEDAIVMWNRDLEATLKSIRL